MKKALLLVLALTVGIKWAAAQEENNLKNFRFGLKAAPTLYWYKPDDKKKFESGGTVAKFSYGLMMEFRLNNVAVIATGLQVDYDGGRLNPLDTNYYFLSKDDEFLSREDTAGSQYTLYQLRERRYNNTYVTLPFTLKLKTKEIGMLTYYGQFGLNSSIRLKGRVDDEVGLTTGNGNATQTDIDNTKDMAIAKFALNIGGGVEWNLSGSTSLVFGLNYFNGFGNVLQGESEYLFRTASNNYAATKQNARSNGLALTVGVLF